ncbi:CopM family metallochaperone [Rhizobium sp.]
MKTTACLVLGATLALSIMALPVAAQDSDPSRHDMSTMEPTPATEGAAKAYMDGMAKMSRDMTAAMTGDADVDFATMMIPHHQGAIDMAKVHLQYGKDPELRRLSEAVVSAQQGEISVMKGWLEKHPAPSGGTEHAQHTPSGMAYMTGMEKMNADMGAEMSGDADRDFVTMMIPHHEGAIAMAKVQLEHGRNAELRKLSEAIIKAQESEIAVMRVWLAKR